MAKVRYTNYYVLYTMDGETREELSTLKPSVMYEVMTGRNVDTVYLDVYSCDLIGETESVQHQHKFTLEEVDKMDNDHFKKMVVGLLSYDEMEDLKNWF